MAKVLISRKKPQVTQVEDVDLLQLFVQFAGFYLFVALWFACAFVGNNPIHVTPVQVNELTSENSQYLYESGHQDYFMTYALLFIFIAVHNTIRI